MAGRTRAPTRQRILDAAQRLFEQRGYNGTGIAEILREAEANAGSLYHYFASKEALLLAVLQRHVDRLDEGVLGPAERRSSSPAGRVSALLDMYRTTLHASGFRRGCPVGDLALEVSGVSAEARAKVAEYFDRWCAGVQRWLEEDGTTGADAARSARLLLSVVQGALMQARALRSLTPFDASVVQLPIPRGAAVSPPAKDLRAGR